MTVEHIKLKEGGKNKYTKREYRHELLQLINSKLHFAHLNQKNTDIRNNLMSLPDL